MRFDKFPFHLRFTTVPSLLKQIVMLVLVTALFARGNASKLHYHVEVCGHLPEVTCCDHGTPDGHKSRNLTFLEQHGHCPHECRDAEPDQMGADGLTWDLMMKPCLKPVVWLVLRHLSVPEKHNFGQFELTHTGPPPSVHGIRDTVRLL